ncbi:MAG: AEC family transporter [Planctomycetota bacterium]
MSVLLQVVETLLPLVVLVGLGLGLVRFGFLSDGMRRQFDRWVYWVGLPALLVAKVSEAGALDASVGRVILAMGVVTVVAALMGWGLWWVASRESGTLGVVVQGGCRGNLAFVGLPVIELGGGDAKTVALAAVGLTATVVLYNVISVGALVWGRETGGNGKDGGEGLGLWMMVRRVGWSMVTNPLIIACLMGVGLAASGWTLPGVVRRSLALVGQPAGPMALMSLGGAMVVYKVRGHLALAGAVTAVKLGVCPAVGYAMAVWLGLDAREALAVLVLSSAPTAVAAYVLVTQLGGDEGLAASIIVLATTGSVVSLGVALALAGGWG